MMAHLAQGRNARHLPGRFRLPEAQAAGNFSPPDRRPALLSRQHDPCRFQLGTTSTPHYVGSVTGRCSCRRASPWAVTTRQPQQAGAAPVAAGCGGVPLLAGRVLSPEPLIEGGASRGADEPCIPRQPSTHRLPAAAAVSGSPGFLTQAQNTDAANYLAQLARGRRYDGVAVRCDTETAPPFGLPAPAVPLRLGL